MQNLTLQSLQALTRQFIQELYFFQLGVLSLAHSLQLFPHTGQLQLKSTHTLGPTVLHTFSSEGRVLPFSQGFESDLMFVDLGVETFDLVSEFHKSELHIGFRGQMLGVGPVAGSGASIESIGSMGLVGLVGVELGVQIGVPVFQKGCLGDKGISEVNLDILARGSDCSVGDVFRLLGAAEDGGVAHGLFWGDVGVIIDHLKLFQLISNHHTSIHSPFIINSVPSTYIIQVQIQIIIQSGSNIISFIREMQEQTQQLDVYFEGSEQQLYAFLYPLSGFKGELFDHLNLRRMDFDPNSKQFDFTYQVKDFKNLGHSQQLKYSSSIIPCTSNYFYSVQEDDRLIWRNLKGFHQVRPDNKIPSKKQSIELNSVKPTDSKNQGWKKLQQTAKQAPSMDLKPNCDISQSQYIQHLLH